MGEKQSKGYWQEDESAPECNGCSQAFYTMIRRHHCRNCGYVFCGDCSRHRATIAMRGLTVPVRVCDACYLALRSTNMVGSAMNRGGPGMRTTGSETPDRASEHGAAARAGCDVHADPFSNGRDAAGNGGVGYSDSVNGGAAAGSTVAQSPAPELTEEQRKAEEYYQSLYRDDGADGTEGGANAHHGVLSPEAVERERLMQRWNAVRQATVYVDILLQQSERVEPDTVVEYSRETEALTLEPEHTQNQIGRKMLPLPRPSADSARYLLEPARPMCAATITDLDEVAAALTQRLRIAVPQHALRVVSPDAFTGY